MQTDNKLTSLMQSGMERDTRRFEALTLGGPLYLVRVVKEGCLVRVSL